MSMNWHKQAIFESKGDKLFSKLGSLRHQFASRLNAHSQTDWAIEDQGKKECCIQVVTRNSQKMPQIVHSAMSNLSGKFHDNPFIYFSMILLIDMSTPYLPMKTEKTRSVPRAQTSDAPSLRNMKQFNQAQNSLAIPTCYRLLFISCPTYPENFMEICSYVFSVMLLIDTNSHRKHCIQVEIAKMSQLFLVLCPNYSDNSMHISSCVLP